MQCSESKGPKEREFRVQVKVTERARRVRECLTSSLLAHHTLLARAPLKAERNLHTPLTPSQRLPRAAAVPSSSSNPTSFDPQDEDNAVAPRVSAPRHLPRTRPPSARYQSRGVLHPARRARRSREWIQGGGGTGQGEHALPSVFWGGEDGADLAGVRSGIMSSSRERCRGASSLPSRWLG